MKLLLVALALASAPVMAADVTAPTSSNNAETRWHPGWGDGGDRGDHWGWEHGHHWGWEHHHRWHRPYRCGFLGRFWCFDQGAADNAAE